MGVTVRYLAVVGASGKCGLCLLFFVAEELASTEDCGRDADEHDDLLHGIPPGGKILTQREPSSSYDIP